MVGSSDDEHDSRTASVGLQRNRSRTSSRHTSREPPSKRQRRNHNGNTTPDVHDFVPQGATFSANTLEVDNDSTSSSGTDSSDSGESDSDQSSVGKQSKSKPDSAPAPNWNKGSRGAIRTSLRSRQVNNDSFNQNSTAASSSRFDAVNGKYWRSRSASASPLGVKVFGAENKSENEDNKDKEEYDEDDDDMEEGEVNENESVSGDSGDSDDSESLDSEADDSILLNIGSRGQNQNRALSPSEDDDDGDDGDEDENENEDDDYDPEALPLSSRNSAKDTVFIGTQNGIHDGSAPMSKESALDLFAKKYPAAPAVLADLERTDMELQARVIFYSQDINDINLQLPITCTECLREGHLAEVCPGKECVHCGAWNQHQSSFCPKWRRCQRCRERGHDGQQCSSALKSSASEIPCDLCGSSDHLELDCDFMWKLPRKDMAAMPVLVSISCSHCTSTRHLAGDCPSLARPLASSSWTLRGIDPSVITNINSVVNPRKGLNGGGGSSGQRGMKIRGRAEPRSPSPESDDLVMSRRPQPAGGRYATRGNIRFGNGIGKNKNLGQPPRDIDSRTNYREREDFSSRNNGRQRTLSPRGGGGRGRGNHRNPQSRSPPRGPSKPPLRSARGGGDRGGRGGGNRGGRGRGGGGGDVYRPLPGAAKKAWDKYRLS